MLFTAEIYRDEASETFEIEASDLRGAWKQLKVAVFTRTGLEILPGWFTEKDVNVFVRQLEGFRHIGNLQEGGFPFPKKDKQA